MNWWQNSDINPSAWVYVFTAIIVLLMASAAMSYQSVKAALMDPVKSLRSE